MAFTPKYHANQHRVWSHDREGTLVVLTYKQLIELSAYRHRHRQRLQLGVPAQ